MPGRREERKEERENFGRGGNATRYQMRQKMVSIGDDFFIENEKGDRAFKVDGKAARVRDTLIFEDMQGKELCKIQEKKIAIKDTTDIEGPGGDNMATVKKAMLSPIRERYHADVSGGPDLDIQGNFTDHEHEIEADGKKVAEISKKWFRVRDTYGVEVAPEQNDVLLLAVTVAIDMMAH